MIRCQRRCTSAQRNAFQSNELDSARAHTLHQLVDERIERSFKDLNRSLLGKLRDERAADAGRPETDEGCRKLEAAIWLHLENGELDRARCEFLLESIEKVRQEAQERGSAKPG